MATSNSCSQSRADSKILKSITGATSSITQDFHQPFLCEKASDLIIRSTLQEQETLYGYRCYIHCGKDRLLSTTIYGLLETLQEMGFGDHKIGVEMLHGHTTWESVDEAHTCWRAYQVGHVINCPRTMIHPEPHDPRVFLNEINRQIITPLGGTPITYWRQPKHPPSEKWLKCLGLPNNGSGSTTF